MSADGPPPGEGWIAMSAYPGNRFQEHVLDAWGAMEGEVPVVGFRVAPHQSNPRGACHGGMLMTFCDYLLPTIARLADPHSDVFTPTVSMTVNFLAPAPLGAWLVGRATMRRRTSNLVFVDGMISDGATAIVQASGIFKGGKHDARRAGSGAMLERLRASIART